jgi:hypothetical protein
MDSNTGSGSKTRRILGVVLLLIVFGMSLGGFLIPVHADVMQPPRPGTEWIGVPPTVSVDCGRFWDPQSPTWPQGVEHITDGDRSNAVEACAQAYTGQRLMAVVSGGTGVLLLALILWSVLRTRRGT